ncbi:hypothetical protein [Marinobacter shengliensis]|uniref:hypothetical protein n=1 Tax=Marinobacter shengliensis TaxID=1389223 RepID=UPI001E5247DD|nr:hypothetical protein [Marinobacter shengliensis]MCD1628511.1 hypothetical protein [Marinobacter shengliensis]
MSDLLRYRVTSQDGDPARFDESETGYWTPWYIAERRCNDLRAKLEKAEARVAELEGQFHVKQLASLMRGLEVKPGFGSMPPEGFYALGRAITDQAKAATEPAILRKQAEAILAAEAECRMLSIDGFYCWSLALEEYAQRLRQQADEAERAGGEK